MYNFDLSKRILNLYPLWPRTLQNHTFAIDQRIKYEKHCSDVIMDYIDLLWSLGPPLFFLETRQFYYDIRT